MKVFLLVLSILFLTSCISDSDYTSPAPSKKSTRYYLYQSFKKKNGVVTFTVSHDGTCAAKSYYQIDQLIDTTPATFVSYINCEKYEIQKGYYNSSSSNMTLNFVNYKASINGNELTVTKITTDMWDTYEEINIERAY
ncbi:hypothetical protein ACNFU2_19760 [Chryseobacterium sp. PTM-20240506]|uniref:hypothetical protein n=1 Tax=unclassified Chryseobacterium TaxID=2593645 RepID=UPI00235900EB|nr:hypothetical protein [Chryseobacterium sp. B21-037]MDC8107106.1 hypothetical protein [Chryseobacterium sp. B21-037]WBV56309.1 hypothetical protein PFY10_19140 [Chryseobacterium daecheongense]